MIIPIRQTSTTVFAVTAYILVVAGLALGFPADKQAAAAKIPFRFEDVVWSSKFPVRGFNGNWITGNEFVYRNEESNIVRYNVELNVEEEFFNAEILVGTPSNCGLHLIGYSNARRLSGVIISHNWMRVTTHHTVYAHKLSRPTDCRLLNRFAEPMERTVVDIVAGQQEAAHPAQCDADFPPLERRQLRDLRHRNQVTQRTAN